LSPTSRQFYAFGASAERS